MENTTNTLDLVAPTESKFDYVPFVQFVKAHGGRVTAIETPVNKKLVQSVGSVYLYMKDEFKQKSLELIKNNPDQLLVGIAKEVDENGNRGCLLVERRSKVLESFDFN